MLCRLNRLDGDLFRIEPVEADGVPAR